MQTQLIIATSLSLISLQALAYEADARVINAEPINERIYNQEQCTRESNYNPPQQRSNQSKDYTGSVIGAIAGGLLGSTIGNGNGRIVAAAAGAGVGAMVGDNIARPSTPEYTQNYVQEKCSSGGYTYQTTGYRVTYIYDNREYTTNMPYNPGTHLPVSIQVTPRY